MNGRSPCIPANHAVSAMVYSSGPEPAAAISIIFDPSKYSVDVVYEHSLGFHFIHRSASIHGAGVIKDSIGQYYIAAICDPSLVSIF